MNLVVNGSPLQVAERRTVAEVVERVAPARAARGTAVAVNGEVVRRAEWDSITLKDGDRVEVLHAIGGG